MKTKMIRALQFRKEVEKERKLMPEPEALLRRAGRFPEAPQTLCASDYGETINTLRSKGYTWGECQQWLAAHNAVYSTQAIGSGWRHWRAKNLKHFDKAAPDNVRHLKRDDIVDLRNRSGLA